MNMVLGLIFAVVVIGAGMTLFPPVKTITDVIFNTTLVATMPTYMQTLVGFWPIFFLSFFVFGGYILIKRGGGQ